MKHIPGAAPRIGTIALVLGLAACGGANATSTPNSSTNQQASSVPASNLPTYPPAPATGVLAVPDFTFVNAQECQHPCTAPVYLDAGNKSGALVKSWPCEYYVGTGTGYCIDPAKARARVRDQVLVVCRKPGSSDPEDGTLWDDRHIPVRDWFQIVIPKELATKLSNPSNPSEKAPLASDGTYRGYIAGVWLRQATDPRGYPHFDVTAPDC